MRVAENDGREAGSGRVEVQVRDLVQHPEQDLANLDNVRCRQGRGPVLGVDVPSNGESRGNGLEVIDHLWPPDVAGVNDELRPLERSECLGPHEPVRVRDEADDRLAIAHATEDARDS